MSKYSNEDLKWITIHPNGKGEKPGVHVAINGAGKVVAGPKDVKNELNAEGGLPGAKSVPLEELKKDKTDEGGGESDFIEPDDDVFSDLFDDDTDFTPPDDDVFSGLLDDTDDNGENSAEAGNKFPQSMIEKYAEIQAKGDPQKKALWLKYLNENQDKLTDNGMGGIAMSDSEAYAKAANEIDQAVGTGGVNIQPPKSDGKSAWMNKVHKWVANNEWEHSPWKGILGLEGEEAVEALEDAAMQLDEEDFKDGMLELTDEGVEHLEEIIAEMKANGEIGPTKPEPKFTDEQIDDLVADKPDEATKEAWKKVVAQHPDWFVYSDIFGIIPLAGKYDEVDEAVANAMNGGAEKTDVSNEPQKFTDDQIEKYAKKIGTVYKLTKDQCEYVKSFVKSHSGGFKELPSGNIAGADQDTFGKMMDEVNKISSPPDAKTSEPTDGTAANQSAATPQPDKPVSSNLPPPPPAQPVSAGLTEGGVPFPKDAAALGSLTMVKPLGGASGANATLYKDANGNMFVMKRFEASDKIGQQRLKEECDADAYYLAGGASVPHFKLYGDEQNGYTKLSEYIPNTKTLGQVWGSADEAMRTKIKEGLKKSFALDVMAGAWDVLGTGQDNILVDKDGNVYRCDNGGAFNRRAQGGEKSEETWGNGHIDDLWTMRGMSAGLDGKTVSDGTGKKDFFGDITTHQLLSDIASRDWDKMIAHLPDATRKVMEKRIANAKEYHAVCDNVVTAGMYGDGQHSEDITLNYHCLNKFGAKAGCTNQNIGPGNWGFCRGNGNGNPAPTLSQFLTDKPPQLTDFTNAPEPQLATFMPNSDVNAAANVLKTAGISLNKHLFVDKDGKPNMTSVDAALALKPKLEAVAKGTDANAKKAQEMLDYVNQIEQMKAGGFKNIATEMPHSPSGAVDLNTPEAKTAAEAAFKTAHADWENKTAHAQEEFKKAEAAYVVKKAAAQKKLDAATKKWQAANGGNTFKWNNLTDCYEDFCKQNGIDSKLFWDMSHGQGSSSQGKGSCRMKVLEILAMGGSLDDPYKSVGGISDHSSDVKYAASEFKSNPVLMKKYQSAYNAMKSLTQMLLHNSTFTGNFNDRRVVRLCRTENKSDVVDNYNLSHGKVNYPMGAHESFGVFKTFSYHGHEAMVCDVPYSRISSLYFLHSPNGGNMYLGDYENEAGVNAVNLPKLYWKEVSSGIPITESYKSFNKVFHT